MIELEVGTIRGIKEKFAIVEKDIISVGAKMVRVNIVTKNLL